MVEEASPGFAGFYAHVISVNLLSIGTILQNSGVWQPMATGAPIVGKSLLLSA